MLFLAGKFLLFGDDSQIAERHPAEIVSPHQPRDLGKFQIIKRFLFSSLIWKVKKKKKDPNVLDVFIQSRAGQAKTSLVKVSRKMVHYCWTKVPDTHAIWLVDAGLFKERSKAVAFTWWRMATEWTFSMLLHPFRTVMLGKKKKATLMHIATLATSSWTDHQHQICQLGRNMIAFFGKWTKSLFLIIHHSDLWVFFTQNQFSRSLFLTSKYGRI